MNNKTNSNKQVKLMIIGAVAVIIVVLMTVLFSNKTEKLDLTQYLVTNPEITGFNGQGQIEFAHLFDDSAFETALLEGSDAHTEAEIEKMSDEELEQLLESGLEGIPELQQVSEYIVLTVWKNDTQVQELNGLSNGDVIRVEVEAKETETKYFNKQLVGGKATFSIDGLKEGIAIDIFEETGLEVSFYGVNGEGHIRYKYDGYAVPDLDVEFSGTGSDGSYSNGDTVEIMVVYDEGWWNSLGYYPNEKVRVYTVEGLDEYVVSLEQLSENDILRFKEAAMKELNDDFSTAFMGLGFDGSVDYYEMYIKYAKSSDMISDDECYNYIVVVGTYIYPETQEPKYCYSLFKEVSVLGDGTVMPLNNEEFSTSLYNWGLSEEELKEELFSDDRYVHVKAH